MSLESLGTNKSTRSRAAIHATAGGLNDFAKLLVSIDSNPSFRFGKKKKHRPRGKEETLDKVFQGLLKEANRELVSLLRELHAGPDTHLLDSAGSQAIRGLLRRALQCATKQYMLQTELSNLVLQDELTGLYNRRGFLALAERQLKLARETTFRDSDVIARFGGDEFAVLAIEASGQSEATIRERLTEYLNSAKLQDSDYRFSVSLGAARFDPWNQTSIRDLIAEADRAMYEQKRRRSAERGCSGVLSILNAGLLSQTSNSHIQREKQNES